MWESSILLLAKVYIKLIFVLMLSFWASSIKIQHNTMLQVVELFSPNNSKQQNFRWWLRWLHMIHRCRWSNAELVQTTQLINNCEGKHNSVPVPEEAKEKKPRRTLINHLHENSIRSHAPTTRYNQHLLCLHETVRYLSSAAWQFLFVWSEYQGTSFILDWYSSQNTLIYVYNSPTFLESSKHGHVMIKYT